MLLHFEIPIVISGRTILVIGKNGQLAKELSKIASETFTFLGREDIDLTSTDSILEAVEDYSPLSIINASAYTAVDKAEANPEAAYALNCRAVEKLASVCKAKALHLVHVSTDYVFSGDKGSPYMEDDNRAPLNVYGASKAAGEELLESLIPNLSCVIRTSWVYSTEGNNFVKTMLNLMKSHDSLRVVDDQIGSPTWAKGLAQACYEAARSEYTGTFHWTDEGSISWYDFACAIQELAENKRLIKKGTHLIPVPSSDYPTPAKRPNYIVMNKTKTKSEFKTPLLHWRHQLNKMLEELKSEF